MQWGVPMHWTLTPVTAQLTSSYMHAQARAAALLIACQIPPLAHLQAGASTEHSVLQPCNDNTAHNHVHTANSSNMMCLLASSAGSLDSTTHPEQFASLEHRSDVLEDSGADPMDYIGSTRVHSYSMGSPVVEGRGI